MGFTGSGGGGGGGGARALRSREREAVFNRVERGREVEGEERENSLLASLTPGSLSLVFPAVVALRPVLASGRKGLQFISAIRLCPPVLPLLRSFDDSRAEFSPR